MSSWPPVLFWLPPESARNWWEPVLRAGYSVHLDSREDIERRHAMFCKEFNRPPDPDAVDRILANTCSGTVLSGEAEMRVFVHRDMTGDWDLTQSWWAEILFSRGRLRGNLVRIFMASGAELCWGPSGCKKIWLVSQELVQSWWGALVPPGATVQRAPSLPPGPASEGQFQYWDGTLRRGKACVLFF
jgi:hypothetical protein